MRVLVVGGGCRGLELARGLVADGHAVRITTRTEDGRAAIEAAGAECWIGTPDRIGSLRYALEGVTIVCWLLASASGEPQDVAALHGSRLEFMLSQMIDTTVRGLLYERQGSVDPAVLAAGAELVAARAGHNVIPYVLFGADPSDSQVWAVGARTAIDGLL